MFWSYMIPGFFFGLVGLYTLLSGSDSKFGWGFFLVGIIYGALGLKNRES